MCLFQKHLEQIFTPSDQTEMSLLPALMPTPGEKKELRFLAIWRTWDKVGRSPGGKKSEGDVMGAS